MMHNKRSSSKQSSVATIGGNDDLLMEILIFLPAKSLMRFKLVSKHWSSLISDTSFILRHCRRPKPQHSFILRVSGMTQQFFVCNPTIKRLIPYRFTWPFVKILQSCNGLLLLECRKFKEGYKAYFVFNPTTMQYRELNIYGGLGTYSGISLIFDPSKSHHYRVVRFRSDNSTKFFVYDSMTHSWNDGGEFHEGPSKYNDGVCWNDHLYFIKHSNTTSFCFSPEEKIVSIHSPNTPRVRGRKNYTVESDGHLHCLSLYPKQDKIHLRIFEMMTDNNWSISTRSDSKRLSATFDGDNTKEIDLLGMIREEREEDSMLLIHVPGKILIYRFSNEVSEVLVDFTRDYIYQEGRLQFEFKDAHPFIDSLAPV